MPSGSLALTHHLRQIRSIWRRRWHLAILGFALPLAATAGLVPFLPNVYRATAVVLVERQQVPEALVKSTITNELETRLTTITQEVLSLPRLEKLVVALGLYPADGDDLSRKKLAGQIAEDTDIDLRAVDPKVRGGQILAFTVSHKGDDPETVTRIANAVAGAYLEENARSRGQVASSTARFLQTQLDDVKVRLLAQEARVSEFKRRHMGETPQNLQGNLGMLEQLSTQLRLNGENLARASERRENLARQLAEMDRAAGTSTPSQGVFVDPTVTRLTKLREELAEHLTRYTEKYPDVVRLRAEIATLESTLSAVPGGSSQAGSGSAAVAPYSAKLRELLDEAETQLKVLNAEEKGLRTQMAIYQRRVETAPRLEQELHELTRDYDTTNDLYQSLLKRRDEADLAENLEQRQQGEQFRIMELASVPDEPWAPKRLRLFLLGLGMAFALAVGAAVLAEHLDVSFHTVEELRAAVAVPIVARIPRITSDRDRRHARWRLAVGGALTSVLFVAVLGASYLTAHGRMPVVSDAVFAAVLRK
jgi:polysaccharide chain length determinant protein (PEP-CTERM system associated)